MRRLCSTLSSLVGAPDHLEVAVLGAERGRGVRCTRALQRGEVVLSAKPIGRAYTAWPSSVERGDLCQVCARPRGGGDRPGLPQCAPPCARVMSPGSVDATTAKLVEQCDWSELEKLHREEGRKFPIIIGSILSRALVELHRYGGEASPTMSLLGQLCFAELLPSVVDGAGSDGGAARDLAALLAAEHSALLDVFAKAGVVAEAAELEGLFPLDAYVRSLGALQLNAFEVHSAHGVTFSAILDGCSSFFNHSCEPSLLVRPDKGSGATEFVAAADVAAGEELCISYIDVEQSGTARRRTLHEKYGFACKCSKCTTEEALFALKR